MAVLSDPLNKTLYSRDAGGRLTFWYPPTLWREAATKFRQEHGDSIKSPFVAPRAAAGFAWNTHLVGVVASLDGNFQVSQKQLAKGQPITLVVYQRTDPAKPHYSPNFGFEGGVFIQFVVTYYDALPNMTLFLQEGMRHHNPHWMDWARCVLPTASWAPLTAVRINRLVPNGQTLDTDHAFDAIVEQCWRDLLRIFNRSYELQPRALRPITYFGGSSAIASRTHLRRFPLSTYEAAHRMLAGGDGRCVTRELQWKTLAARRRRNTLPYDSPLGLGKHTSGAAFESLHAVVIGGLGLQDAHLYNICAVYRHRTMGAGCKRSPCPGMRINPEWVSPGYRSPLFVPELRLRSIVAGKILHERRAADRKRERLRRQQPPDLAEQLRAVDASFERIASEIRANFSKGLNASDRTIDPSRLSLASRAMLLPTRTGAAPPAAPPSK